MTSPLNFQRILRCFGREQAAVLIEQEACVLPSLPLLYSHISRHIAEAYPSRIPTLLR